MSENPRPVKTPIAIVGDSRVERLARSLAEIRLKIARLEEERQSVSDRILLIIQHQGVTDDEGKVRFETDHTRFQIVHGTNTTVSAAKLKVALLGIGLTPKQIASVTDACVKTVHYEYPGCYPKAESVAARLDDQAAS